MNGTLKLANGQTFACGWCGAAGPLSICFAKPYPAAALAAAFSDPENTRRIEYSGGDGVLVFEGYTDFAILQMHGWYDGNPIITLNSEG